MTPEPCLCGDPYCPRCGLPGPDESVNARYEALNEEAIEAEREMRAHDEETAAQGLLRLVEVRAGDLADALDAYIGEHDVCGGADCSDARCVVAERLRAALEAPSASETPDLGLSGSRDDRTSTAPSETLSPPPRVRHGNRNVQNIYLINPDRTETFLAVAMSPELAVWLVAAINGGYAVPLKRPDETAQEATQERGTMEILGQPLLAPVVDGDEFDRYRIAPGDDAVIVNCPRDDCGAIVLVEESPTLGDVMDAAVDHEGDAHGGYKPIRCEVVDTPHGSAAVQADGPFPEGAVEQVVEATIRRADAIHASVVAETPEITAEWVDEAVQVWHEAGRGYLLDDRLRLVLARVKPLITEGDRDV